MAEAASEDTSSLPELPSHLEAMIDQAPGWRPVLLAAAAAAPAAIATAIAGAPPTDDPIFEVEVLSAALSRCQGPGCEAVVQAAWAVVQRLPELETGGAMDAIICVMASAVARFLAAGLSPGPPEDAANSLINKICELDPLPEGFSSTGCVPILTSMVSPGNDGAVAAVGNVVASCDTCTQQALDSGLLEKLGPVVESSDPKKVEQAIWILANCAANVEEQAQAVLDSGIVPKALEAPDRFPTKRKVRTEALFLACHLGMKLGPSAFETFLATGAAAVVVQRIAAGNRLMEDGGKDYSLTACLEAVQSMLKATARWGGELQKLGVEAALGGLRGSLEGHETYVVHCTLELLKRVTFQVTSWALTDDGLVVALASLGHAVELHLPLGVSVAGIYSKLDERGHKSIVIWGPAGQELALEDMSPLLPVLEATPTPVGPGPLARVRQGIDSCETPAGFDSAAFEQLVRADPRCEDLVAGGGPLEEVESAEAARSWADRAQAALREEPLAKKQRCSSSVEK